ncbi:glycine-rich domain-containing protein [Pseudomonas sp. Marseille-Q5299]|uniref:glycine-rich domain-containing protein n=1 Tax=Pseudomonas sp. Marseille-Q5299 TaxID=2942201 RepID=UPI0033657B2B
MTNALALKAPLASPTFTGDPKAPTPAVTDNDTSLATTAFVRSVLARYGLATSTAYVWTGNIDQIVETGVYTVSNGATGTRPKQPGTVNDIVAGEILHLERDGTNCAVQIWESLTGGLDAPAGGKSGITFKRSRVSGGEWTAWGQMWDGVNTPKQTSAIDTTAGTMLTVGSFGAGSAIVTTEVDMNSFQVPGNYLTAASGLLNLPAGWNAAQRHCMVVDGLGASGHLVQTLSAGLAGGDVKQAIRTLTSGKTWTDWEEVTTSRHGPFRGTQTYKTAGVFTWTVPAGVKKAWVTVIGGGGGGGFSPSAGIGSAGGGGGGMSQRLVDLSGVTSVAVTVGAGGAGATESGSQGGTGGTSSFGAYLSATGGVGGAGNSGTANAGGTGGLGFGGDFNTTLGPGFSNYGTQGGTGGGPGVRASQAPVVGGAAAGPGGGGSGAYTGYAGGAGAAGQVIIQW